MRQLLTIVICIFFTSLAHPQFPSYFVYLYKGQGEVYRSGNQKLTFQARQLIFPSDQLFLKTSSSEVTLVNREGEFIVVTGKGIHAVKDLHVQKRSNGITQKYLHLVWEELLDPAHESSSTVKAIAASWGGAVRGGCDLTYFPRNGYQASADSLSFYWKGDSSASSVYVFLIRDKTSTSVFRKELKDTQLAISRNVLPKDQVIFYWSVTSSTTNCKDVPTYQFELVDPQIAQTRIKAIKEAVAKELDPITYNLFMADQLGKNGFIDEAVHYIRQADMLFKAQR